MEKAVTKQWSEVYIEMRDNLLIFEMEETMW